MCVDASGRVAAVTAVATLAVAAAVSVWPSTAAVKRLRWASGVERPVRNAFPETGLLLAGILVTGLFIGAGPAVAAGVIAGVTVMRRRRSRGARRRRANDEALRRAVGVMAAEMTVGAPMVTACRSAAEEIDDAAPESAAELRRLAARVELGGEADAGDAGGEGLSRLVESWAISARYGVPMAALLAALARDLAERRNFADRTEAGLAGPRATAMVLAGLPVLAALLGQLMGADPLGVLLGTSLGGILLVVGATLAAAGIWWSDAIVAKVLR